MFQDLTETNAPMAVPPSKWPFDAGIFMGDLNYRVVLPGHVSVSLSACLANAPLNLFILLDAEI